MSANDLIARVAAAIESADVGYSIQLTSLVDGVSTYTATIYGQEPRKFDDMEDARIWVNGFRSEAKARAAIYEARRTVLEEAAQVAESHRVGEQLIRHKMSEVDQVGVVSTTIARAIRALAALEPTP